MVKCISLGEYMDEHDPDIRYLHYLSFYNKGGFKYKWSHANQFINQEMKLSKKEFSQLNKFLGFFVDPDGEYNFKRLQEVVQLILTNNKEK